MAYITAITNRTIEDVKNKTSKAYFNIADWERIYNNTILTKNLAEILLSSGITLSTLTAPTITTIPTAVSFNALLTNIETLRLAVMSESITGAQTEINDAWEAGSLKTAPDWEDVNLWESTINAIWNHFNGATYDNCPTLTVNLTVTTGNQEIYIDCLDAADYNIDLQGTAKLYII